MIEVRPFDTLGGANHGWLDAHRQRFCRLKIAAVPSNWPCSHRPRKIWRAHQRTNPRRRRSYYSWKTNNGIMISAASELEERIQEKREDEESVAHHGRG
jgi:hypothetical protein